MTEKSAYTRVSLCPHGCPVLVLSDENGEPIAEAHIRLDFVETLVADLRRAAAEGVAMLRLPA